jgi:plasmid stabilization system protein ParE
MVKYILRWSEQAKIDLKEIFDYVKETRSREQAKYVVNGIRTATKEITVFPTKHQKDPFITSGAVRYAVKWRYKILFTISEKYINIVRIFHTAQHPNKLF